MFHIPGVGKKAIMTGDAVKIKCSFTILLWVLANKFSFVSSSEKRRLNWSQEESRWCPARTAAIRTLSVSHPFSVWGWMCPLGERFCRSASLNCLPRCISFCFPTVKVFSGRVCTHFHSIWREHVFILILNVSHACLCLCPHGPLSKTRPSRVLC